MIYEFSGLMPETLCDKIIHYYNHSEQRRSWWQDEKFFTGRTLSTSDVEDEMLKKEIKAFEYRVVQKSYKKFKQFIYPEFSDIVYWSPEMSMPPHIDDSEGLEFRHYTMVCYLNDDYKGGETFFPTENYICIPQKGKVVIFPSNISHGVKTVKESSRYTLVIWYTRDETHLKIN